MSSRILIFLSFVFANVILKALSAGVPPFSYDEIISVKNTLLHFGHIKHEAEWDNNPPFYYYCLWVWHQVVPVSEFTSRFLSVLFVSTGIGVTYLLARDFFSDRVAILAASMLSFSNFITYYAQETRAYSLVFLLAILSSFLFFYYLKNKRKATNFLLAFVNFLLVYSHYIAALVIFFQWLVFAIYGKKERRQFYFIQSLVIGVLIVLRFTPGQYSHILGFDNGGDFWLKEASVADLLVTIKQLFFNTVISFFFVLVLCVYLVRRIWFGSLNIQMVEAYLLCVGFGSVVLLFVVGLFKPVFLSRYLIFCVPFATLFIINEVVSWRPVGLIICVLALLVQIFHLDLSKSTSMDFRGAANVIQQIKTNDDVIIVNTRDNLGLFLYYYDRKGFFANPDPDSASRANRIYGVNDAGDLDDLPWNRSRRVYLVQAFHKLNRSDNPVAKRLSDKISLKYRSEAFKGVEFSVYTR